MNNDGQAVEWYQKAAEQGIASAFTLPSTIGIKTLTDIMKNTHLIPWIAIAVIACTGWMTSVAHAEEDAIAQYNRGWNYYDDEDYLQAAYWWKKAAEQDYAYAQYHLGLMYENCIGVTQDDEKAVQWYQKAAEQGLAEAQNNLGVMYQHGRGVTQDKKKAVEWYLKSAEQGLVNAQYNLGVMYGRGTGVTLDYDKGVYWVKKAAEQGHADAIQTLKMLGVTN